MQMPGMSSGTDAASPTSGASPSSTMDMGDMDMDMGSMHMFFTRDYKNYPVLFLNFSAKNAGEAFGIFVLLFFVAFAARGLEYFRTHLEQKVWNNPVYNAPPPKKDNCCDSVSEHDFKNDASNISTVDEGAFHRAGLPLASVVFRDIIRLILCIVPDLLGYALMLVAMTYTLTYFFAVVLGSGIGRFFFERLAERQGMKGTPLARHC